MVEDLWKNPPIATWTLPLEASSALSLVTPCKETKGGRSWMQWALSGVTVSASKWDQWRRLKERTQENMEPKHYSHAAATVSFRNLIL